MPASLTQEGETPAQRSMRPNNSTVQCDGLVARLSAMPPTYTAVRRFPCPAFTSGVRQVLSDGRLCRQSGRLGDRKLTKSTHSRHRVHSQRRAPFINPKRGFTAHSKLLAHRNTLEKRSTSDRCFSEKPPRPPPARDATSTSTFKGQPRKARTPPKSEFSACLIMWASRLCRQHSRRSLYRCAL